MPLYHYEALDANGRTVVGTMQVAGEDALHQRLLSMGYEATLVQLSRRELTAAPPDERVVKAPEGVALSKLELPELTVSRFYYQMATYLRAGITSLEALSHMQAQAQEPGLRRIAAEMAVVVQAGGSLSEGMACYPRCFLDGDLGLIQAAELGGFMPQAFQMLADDHEKDHNARRKLRIWQWFFNGQMIGLILIIPFVMLINNLLGGFWDSPDIMAYVGEQLRGLVINLLLISLPLTALYVAVLWYVKRMRIMPATRRMWHRWLLRFGVTAGLQKARASAALTRTLHLLHHAGLDNVRVWETAAGVIPNLELSSQALEVTPVVRESGSLSQALMQSQLIHPNEAAAVAAGEQSGQLEQALDKVAGYYETELDSTLGSSVVKGTTSLVVWAFILGFAVLALVAGGYLRGILRFIDSF